MNERDQELIVDLIDGRLDPQAERAALARLESDPGFRAEYETQRAMSSVLADVPVPSMTSDERTRLHAALKRELNFEPPVVAAAPARPSRWRRWLAPVGSLAAAAAVLAGVFVFLPQSADDSTEVALDTVTTSAAAEALGGGEVADQSTAESETTDRMTFGETAPAAEAPQEDDADNRAVGAAAFSVPYVPDVTLDEIAAGISLRDKAAEPDEAGAETGQTREALIADCLDSLTGTTEIASVLPLATTSFGTSKALAVEITPIDGDPYHALYSLDTCVELRNTQG